MSKKELEGQKVLLVRLYNKHRTVRDKRTGVEFEAVHHNDIDYEYWRLTGESLQ